MLPEAGSAAVPYAAWAESHYGILKKLSDQAIKVGWAKGQTN